MNCNAHGTLNNFRYLSVPKIVESRLGTKPKISEGARLWTALVISDKTGGSCNACG